MLLLLFSVKTDEEVFLTPTLTLPTVFEYFRRLFHAYCHPHVLTSKHLLLQVIAVSSWRILSLSLSLFFFIFQSGVQGLALFYIQLSRLFLSFVNGIRPRCFFAVLFLLLPYHGFLSSQAIVTASFFFFCLVQPSFSRFASGRPTFSLKSRRLGLIGADCAPWSLAADRYRHTQTCQYLARNLLKTPIASQAREKAVLWWESLLQPSSKRLPRSQAGSLEPRRHACVYGGRGDE